MMQYYSSFHLSNNCNINASNTEPQRRLPPAAELQFASADKLALILRLI